MGFALNDKKSIWSPKKEMNWKGFAINSELGILFIPKDWTKTILHWIEEMIQKLTYTAAGKLATFCGKIISKKLVIGNFFQLKIRKWYNINWVTPVLGFLNQDVFI